MDGSMRVLFKQDLKLPFLDKSKSLQEFETHAIWRQSAFFGKYCGGIIFATAL